MGSGSLIQDISDTSQSGADTSLLITRSVSGSSMSGSSMAEISSTVIISPSSESTQPQPTPQGQVYTDIPPRRWIEGSKPGYFFDPISRTSWRYDPILGKFISPDNGWYLVTRYGPRSSDDILGQYYYDPLAGIMIDIESGDYLDPATLQPIPEGTIPTLTPVITPTITPAATIPANTSDDACLVTCPDCAGGTCHDCNANQICDETEGAASGTQGQSEQPQDTVLPAPTEQPTGQVTIQPGSSSQSEEPQTIPVPTQTPNPEGGLSESAQAPILAMQAGQTWSNTNDELVENGPDNPTLATFEKDVSIISITTYHLNNGEGVQQAGTIGLIDSQGVEYGPWQATGQDGPNGEPNGIWVVNPTTDTGDLLSLKSGTYTISDSDEETWSHNAQSEYSGFGIIHYFLTLKGSNLPTIETIETISIPNGTTF